YNTVDNKVLDMGAAAPFWIGGTYQRVCGPPNDCIPGADGLEELPVGAWLVDTPIDTNGDGALDDSDRFFLCNDGTLSDEPCDVYASPVPRHSGTFGTDVTLYNRLTISALADWAAGFWVHDWGSMWATYNGIYRRELVDDSYEYPILHDAAGNALGAYGPYSAISEFLYDGDYMKLREISARYAVPEEWSSMIGADNARVYASIRNVAIWSRNDLVDPELNGLYSGDELNLGGETSITISPPRMFRFGVELSF
ncbi:MAG: hypothetical protein GWM93_06270, partial [Gemmatimonadetes bacterium]|nr:hypothetical protein [Gemmatimonadota bacterium]NIT66282.1 hypothetical protein [Gemmatimonadota bacterium]NIW74712.1 hypothetical protein [Gemmatimonadota bacterium]NIY34859.1 hypothetical protein [Gemmatimonadota bacterium]